tara:strand:+ start:1382 stop:1687 length:306 start_codon:yes stop_codon:yes gene_type:complete
MNRFNIRSISAPLTAAPTPIADKKPSAYHAMKHGSPVAPIAVPTVAEEPKKKGRPSKEEVRRHKMAMASAGIALLISDKPTRNKIRNYMQSRIESLDEEKM